MTAYWRLICFARNSQTFSQRLKYWKEHTSRRLSIYTSRCAGISKKSILVSAILNVSISKIQFLWISILFQFSFKFDFNSRLPSCKHISYPLKERHAFESMVFPNFPWKVGYVFSPTQRGFRRFSLNHPAVLARPVPSGDLDQNQSYHESQVATEMAVGCGGRFGSEMIMKLWWQCV